MSWRKKYQSSFNGYPTRYPELISRPEHYAGLNSSELISIARGSGGSYGDAALNQQGEIILTGRLDRFLEFDEQQGVISVESGISLNKILQLIVPRGWFLPVTPGTAEVSLGGCVAADVHGKNHRYAGSLGQHVLSLELITASGERLHCSSKLYPELFWATVGGMGLTGIIGIVTLQLKRIETAYMYVRHQVAQSLAQIFAAFAKEDEWEYSVAWLDALNTPLGRGVIIKANHADLTKLPVSQQSQAFSTPVSYRYKVPFYFPPALLHPMWVKSFNKAYYHHLAKKNYPCLVAYSDYFYPLDRISNWPRLYGRQGFIQYQCVFPEKLAYAAIDNLLKTLGRNKQPIYLAVLKRFGNANLAPLSFPLSGFTLALDMPIRNEKLFTCLDELDALVIDAGGRIYLAKDARLKPEAFRAMYPRYPEWLATKQKWDPHNKFNSSLARRLQIGA
jgi:FAD/FMN-containing dehydrogenase